MSGSGSLRYGVLATLVALAGLAVAAPLASTRWPGALGWAVAGWSAVSLVGVADGVWLCRRYGRPGSGFLTALVVGILARLLLVLVGTGLALRYGVDAAPWAFLVGMAGGFVPLQAFEVFWFVKSARSLSGSVS